VLRVVNTPFRLRKKIALMSRIGDAYIGSEIERRVTNNRFGPGYESDLAAIAVLGS
jgi:hypothetical protein